MNQKTNHVIRQMLSFCLLTLMIFTLSCESEVKSRLVYYAMPGWPHCKKVTTIVNGLEKEYKGALKCEVRDASTEESKAEIESYGFGTHGLVVFDATGNVKKKIDGHLMTETDIREAVKFAMDGS